MRLVILYWIILLVIPQLSLASEVGPDPVVNKPQSQKPHYEKQDTKPLMEVDMARPDHLKPVETEGYFYPYSSALSVNLGTSAALVSGSFTPEFYPLINGTFLWPSLKNMHFETGIDVVVGQDGHFYTGLRYIFGSTDQFRPFWSLAPGVQWKPDEKLATFLRLRNYYVRGSAGFESSFWDQYSVRVELFLGVDLGGDAHGGIFSGISYGIL